MYSGGLCAGSAAPRPELAAGRRRGNVYRQRRGGVAEVARYPPQRPASWLVQNITVLAFLKTVEMYMYINSSRIIILDIKHKVCLSVCLSTFHWYLTHDNYSVNILQ